MAWKFDRPEAGCGMVQVFRRARSPFGEAALKLHRLEEGARYVFRDVDSNEKQTLSGSVRLKEGFPVRFRSRPPEARIWTYMKESEL